LLEGRTAILANGPSILEIAKLFDAIDVPDMGPFRVSATERSI